MKEFDKDGLIEGMTNAELGQVSGLMSILSRADWRYDLSARTPMSRQRTAQVELEKLAKEFSDYTEPQKAYFVRRFYTGRMTLDAIAKLLKAFKLSG